MRNQALRRFMGEASGTAETKNLEENSQIYHYWRSRRAMKGESLEENSQIYHYWRSRCAMKEESLEENFQIYHYWRSKCAMIEEIMEQKTIRKDYTSYDYKQVAVEEEQASFCIDCYESFGWKPDENRPIQTGHGKSRIWLKRDRKILNKAELTRLERNFDDCIAQLDEMEKSKTRLPRMMAGLCALLGTVFMAGSVFAVTATPPLIWLCIVLAIPGFLGWLLPYFIYSRGVIKQTEKIAPFIDAKQDEIEEICKKGFSLL